MLSPNQYLRCFAKVFYRQLCNGVSFGPRPTEQDCEIQILLQKNNTICTFHKIIVLVIYK